MDANESSNEMRDPLTGKGSGGDDAASQSSQTSRASLLERIQAQKNRNAGTTATTASATTTTTSTQPSSSYPLPDHHIGEAISTPSTIQVPQYSQISQEASHEASIEIPSHSSSGTATGFFSHAWSNISQSMETGMASLQQDRNDLEARDALLPPTSNDEEHYSMIGYFTTFVRDVYETFLSLPLWVRIIVIFALLYTAWKLI